MALYFIGINQEGNRGQMFQPLVYDTSEHNRKVNAVAGNYTLTQGVLNLQVQKAQLRSVMTSGYQRFRDVAYQLDLDCLCTEITGVVDNDLSVDVVYPRRFDEELYRDFQGRLIENNYLSTAVFTKNEALLIRISSKLTADQIVSLFQSGAYSNQSFDKVFNESMRDKRLRVMFDEPIQSQFFMVADDLYQDSSLKEVFSGASVHRFNRLQYTLGDKDLHDIHMYEQSDFAQCFANALQETCRALGIQTEMIIHNTEQNFEDVLGNREFNDDSIQFLDDDAALMASMRKEKDVAVEQPTLDFDSMEDLFSDINVDFDLNDTPSAIETESANASKRVEAVEEPVTPNFDELLGLDMAPDLNDFEEFFAEFDNNESTTAKNSDDGLDI